MLKLVVYRNELDWQRHLLKLFDSGVIEHILGKGLMLSKYQNRVSTIQKKVKKTSSCIVIEQPEVGLHPMHHCEIAEALATECNNNKELDIVVTTHSKTIINKIGDIIEDKTLGEGFEQNVEILVLDSQVNSGLPDNIMVSKFDAEGNLINWPIGYMTGH